MLLYSCAQTRWEITNCFHYKSRYTNKYIFTDFFCAYTRTYECSFIGPCICHLLKNYLWTFCGSFVALQANSLGTKIIDEDGVLDLIRTLPGKKSKYEIAAEKEVSLLYICNVIWLSFQSVLYGILFILKWKKNSYFQSKCWSKTSNWCLHCWSSKHYIKPFTKVPLQDPMICQQWIQLTALNV